MTASAITSLGEETEGAEKARRRQFTVEFKRRIVKEADACKAPLRARLRHGSADRWQRRRGGSLREP